MKFIADEYKGLFVVGYVVILSNFGGYAAGLDLGIYSNPITGADCLLTFDDNLLVLLMAISLCSSCHLLIQPMLWGPVHDKQIHIFGQLLNRLYCNS